METGELLSWLWRASWQASVLVLLVLLAQWLFRARLAPRWRYALWFLVMVRLALPIVPESSLSIFNYASVEGVARTSDSEASPEVGASEAAGFAGQPRWENSAWLEADAGDEFAAAGPAQLTEGEASPATAASIEGEPLAEAAGSIGFNMIVLAIYIAGVVLLLLRLLVGNLRFARRLRDRQPVTDSFVLQMFERCREEMGVRREVELIETAEVESPALFGLFRLRILLPSGILERFSPEELRYIFLHEFAHVRRGDVMVNWVVAVLQTLHWFNPVIWFGFRRMRSDRELACDALALSHAREGENKTYGETILKLLEGFTQPAAVPGLVGIIEEKSQIKMRMRMIAQFRNRRGWSILALALFAALGVGCLTDELSQRADASGAEAERAGKSTEPLDLTPLYDLHAEEASQFGAWEIVPKGPQVFDRVPFEVGGMIRLFGLIAPPHGTVYREEVTGIPVGREFEQLHLLHGTGWTTEDGVPIARVALNYADGTRMSFLIVYGVHVRDWWHRDLSSPSDVSDPNSSVVWTGQLDYHGGPLGLRFYRSTFENPYPEKEVTSIDLTSERSAVTPAIVSISAGPALPPVRKPGSTTRGARGRMAAVDQREPTARSSASADAEEQQETLRIRVVDDADGQPLANAGLHVNSCDADGCVYIGSFQTDENGEKEISYPAERLESIYISVVRSGYAANSISLDLPASGSQTVRMKLPAGITGQVSDRETGEPVQAFRVLLGQSFGGGSHIYWQMTEDFDTPSGTYHLTVDEPIDRQAVLRVEAEGYLPEVSEEFNMDGDEFKFDFELQPVDPLAGRVTSPNGEPISQAEVALVTPGSGLNLGKGRFKPRNFGQPGTSTIVRTDEEGRFSLTPDPEASAMLFVHQQGYAEIPADKFSSLEDVVLKPWGHVEGVVMIGDRPGANENVAVSPLDGVSQSALRYDATAFNTTTDDQGNFAFDRVPPGRRAIHRIISTGQNSSERSHLTPVEVEPGEVTRVQVGGAGRRVVGQAVADDSDREIDWQSGYRILRSPGPQPPRDFDTREEREEWYQSEEVRRAQQERRSYAVVMEADGAFRAEDVPPGEYQLSIAVTDSRGRNIGSATKKVIVPEMPEGSADEPLDIGEIEIALAREVTLGTAAPDAEFTDLDGNAMKLSDFRGKYVLIDFWATWCGPCVEETPNLKDTYETFGDDDRFEIVALSLDRNRDAPRKYAKENELKWVQGYLGEWGETNVPKQFGVQGIPSYFLLDPEGNIIAKGMRGARIKAAVEAALGAG